MQPLPLSQPLLGLARQSVPMGVIIFFVVGTMVFRLATPTESAAFGCLATGILSVRGCSLCELLRLLYRSLDDTLRVTSMTFILIIAATSFSQLLAYASATGALIESTTRFITTPQSLLLEMFGVLFILGMFLDAMSMMLLTLPIFLPLAQPAGLDPILFGIVMLIGLEVSFITLPFGMLLFVMMRVLPGALLAEVSRAAFS